MFIVQFMPFPFRLFTANQHEDAARKRNLYTFHKCYLGCNCRCMAAICVHPHLATARHRRDHVASSKVRTADESKKHVLNSTPSRQYEAAPKLGTANRLGAMPVQQLEAACEEAERKEVYLCPGNDTAICRIMPKGQASTFAVQQLQCPKVTYIANFSSSIAMSQND